jgi:Protein of unknown function (DUF4242)
MPPDELRAGAQASNDAQGTLAPRLQWQESYVTADKLYCVFIAEDEAAIAEHAELSGFPAHRINRITAVVDPTTGGR